MSNVTITDASAAVVKIDTIQRTEGANTVQTQAVAVIDPATGNPLVPNADGSVNLSPAQVATLTPPAAITGYATETTLAALKATADAIQTAAAAIQTAVVALNGKTTAVDTGNIAGTVTANTGLSQPLTDTQLRASAVPVSGTVTANQGGANWTQNVAQYGGVAVGMGNAFHVQPGTGATFPICAGSLTVLNYSQAGVIAINTDVMVIDCQNLRSLAIQCSSLGTTGAITPAWSVDGTNFQSGIVLTPAGAAISSISTTGLWTVQVQSRYLRLRMTTATTGGTTTIAVNGFEQSIAPPILTQLISGTVTAGASTNLVGDVGVQYRTNNTGAASSINYASPATPVGSSVKAAAGRLLGYQLSNLSGGTRWLKFFNATSVTMGTTAAAFEIPIPAGATIALQLPGGVSFGTGIMIAVTSARGLTDNTSTGLATADIAGALFYA